MSTSLDRAQRYAAVEDMREKIRSLTTDGNFTFVDLRWPEKELDQIAQFEIESSQQYDRFGDLHLLKEEVPNFLKSLGNNTEEFIQKTAEVIAEIASRVIAASSKETAWVCVRSFTPSSNFDTPRWHQDGYYYSPHAGFAFKFAATLRGDSTLFYRLPRKMRETFNAHYTDQAFLRHLVDMQKVESAQRGHGSFFIVGDPNNAAVHSEPKIDKARLFFSVVPGDKAEIGELCARWHP